MKAKAAFVLCLLVLITIFVVACAPAEDTAGVSVTYQEGGDSTASEGPSIISGSIETKDSVGNSWLGLAIAVAGLVAAYFVYSRRKMERSDELSSYRESPGEEVSPGRFSKVLRPIVRFWKFLAPVIPVIFVALLGLAIGAAVACTMTVQTGYVGVYVHFGEAIGTFDPGLHFVIPFIDKVVLFSTHEWTYATMVDPSTGNEDYRDSPINFTSADGVKVSITHTVQGVLMRDHVLYVYKNYGTLENAISQAVKHPGRSIIRESLQGNSVDDIRLNIDETKEPIVLKIEPIMNRAGLNLLFFGFRKPLLGEDGDYETALNDEKVAEQLAAVEEQNVERSKQIAQQGVETAIGTKKSTILAAEAEAESILVKAESQAKANELLTKSISPLLVSYMQWTKWNGVLPTWVTEGSPLVIAEP